MKHWLSYRGVTEITTLSKTTVRRLISEGKFPAPEEITSGRKVFDPDKVESAMEALLEERRREARHHSPVTPAPEAV